MVLNNSTGVEVIMRPAAVSAFMKDRNGPVLRDLVRRATILQTAAKKQVRLGHVGGGERGVRGARGNLRNTIVKRIIADPRMPYLRVGSENPIALIHHEGTHPHVIRPVKAKTLRFPANGGRGGGFVFARVVHHPGTRPNRYLTDNLRLASQ